jgi:hypothetical protein
MLPNHGWAEMNREAEGDELSMAAIVAVAQRGVQGNPSAFVNGTTSVGSYSGPAHTEGLGSSCFSACNAGFPTGLSAHTGR